MARRGSLSTAEARRIALAAQGFTDPVPERRLDRRHIHRVMGRVAAIQLDSVNVVVRSHFVPVYSRLGPYDRAILDRTAYGRRELFEYWGHEASLMPVALQPLFRWRMREGNAWTGMVKVAREHPGYVEAVLQEVADRGPISAGELSEPGPRREGWGWGWSLGKRALEWLFWTGRLSVLRRANFARVYDLPERVLGPEVLAAPTPTEEQAQRELIRFAARSLGVASARDLADYFRIPVPSARPRIAELVEEGTLVPVAVEDWPVQAYLDRSARTPRVVRARTLLTPFDSLIWERARTERLFGFRYRIEIYTPAPKRVHGYYVLPFLLGDRLVARVDLKADRKAASLLVPAAHAEAEALEPLTLVASELATELRRFAAWLGLDSVRLGRGGDLIEPLRRELGEAPGVDM